MRNRILITGGLGFIGSHLVKNILKHTNWDVVVLDKCSYSSSISRLTELKCWDLSRVELIYHDLRAEINGFTHQEIGKIDYVYHLAAESHVSYSIDRPNIFIDSNVKGTANLLSYLKREQDVKKIIVFSTDETYGEAPEGVEYKEGDSLNPSNPYAASKAGADMMAKAFKRCFDMPLIIARSMNAYGERQHPEKFIPKAIKQLKEGKPVTLYGSPEKIPSRRWIHVDDIYDALYKLTIEPNEHTIYHLVGEEHEVKEIAEMIAEIMGTKLKIKWVDARPGEDYGYGLQNNNFDWKRKVDFREGLEREVKYTLKNPKWSL